MYANTADEYALKSGILPPIINANTNSNTPPRNCDIPVTQSGDVLHTLFSLIIKDITVHSDASKIRISPFDIPFHCSVVPLKKIDVNEEQRENALSPILVTPSPIFVAVTQYCAVYNDLFKGLVTSKTRLAKDCGQH